MHFKYLLPIIALALVQFSTWSCKKTLDDPNGNNNNGNTTDTVYFNIEGIKFSNGAVSDISYTTATIRGDFSSVANTASPISDHGFVWATSKSGLTLGLAEGSKSLGPRTSPGVFTTAMTSLTPNTTYYVTGYVISNGATAYHPSPLAFKTLPGTGPAIAAGSATDITATSARIQNVITDFRDDAVSEHGHVWSETNGNVDLTNCGNNKSALGQVAAADDYPFSTVLSGLQPAKTYYYRAYATNQFGTSYSAAATFVTSDAPMPIIVIESTTITADGNSTGTANPGESVTYAVKLKNTGSLTATGVIADFQVGTGATLTSSTPVSFGDVLPNFTKTQSITVSIDAATAWNTTIPVAVVMADGSGNNWTSSFNVTVTSPFVVSENLVLYYDFENQSSFNIGQVKDVTGTVNGVVYGNLQLVNDAPATNGKSVSFPGGTSNYIHVPSDPFNSAPEFSMCFWIKTTDSDGTLFDGYYNWDGDNYHSFRISGTKLYAFKDWSNYHINNVVLNNQWHHLVLTKDNANKMTIYIDGVYFDTMTFSMGSGSSNVPVYYYVDNFIGVDYDGNVANSSSDYSGKMDNIRYYNRTITASEVSQIFNAKQ